MQILYIDGGCSGNDQTNIAIRKMVSVVTDEHGGVLSEKLADGGSNNIAEILAVRDALAWCAEHHVSGVKIFTDSRNNFAWTFGKKVGKHINDRDAVLRVKAEIETLRETIECLLVWVPREQNKAGHYIENRYHL